jgi:hypothetical protein
MRTRILMTRSSLWRVVCTTLLMVAVIAATTSLSAEPKQIPFRASFDAEFQNTIAFPIAHVQVQGTGEAQLMGRSEAVTENELVNVITGEGTATFTLTGANGDTVVLEDTFLSTPPDANGAFTFGGTFEIVGGTGRFAGATGGGTVTGSAQFSPSREGGVAEFSFDGTISSPGKK